MKTGKGKSTKRIMVSIAAAMIGTVVLGLGGRADALLLCAKIKLNTGELREGSLIRLRTACKTRKDGTPLEVAIGNTDDLATAKPALALSETSQDTAGIEERTRIALNDVRARLSEVHATATAGENAVEADAAEAGVALEAIRTGMESLFSGLTPFDPTSLSDTAVKPEALDTAVSLNDWIAKVAELEEKIRIRLVLAEVRAAQAEAIGDPLAVVDYVGDAVAKNLEDLEAEMVGAELVLARDALSAHVDDLDNLVAMKDADFDAANVDMQNMLQKQEDVLQLMSDVSELLHQTSMAIIRRAGN